MRIVVSGATGLIGRALVLHLIGRGDHVTAWVREPARARGQLGPEVTLIATADREALARAVAGADAVIHLAGLPIVGARWTARRKRALTESRVSTAASLVEAIAARPRPRPLPVFVSASAVGFYGDRGDVVLDERAARGDGFAAELCADWEQAAEAARGAAARVVRARIGIVLARGGGALAPLAKLGRLGLGGPIAGGDQYVPWIHLDDVVRAIAHALDTPSLDGAVNVVGPAPVRQRELAAAIGRALGRPAFVPAPRLAVRAILGEAASVLIASQRAVPARLVASGFAFTFASLDAALHDLLRADHGVAIRRVRRDEVPAVDYLARRRPAYVLRARTVLDRPIDEVAPFFAAAENLELITPPDLSFAIATPTPIAMRAGATIDYRIALAGVPMRWRTVIERWEPGRLFVDAQHRGPYRAWWHEHRFTPDGGRTIMEDVVYYAPPLGVLGRLANRAFVARMLRAIFAYRAQAVRLRFAARAPARYFAQTESPRQL
jgi:uncharacterized protein (TIGR01777 family)